MRAGWNVLFVGLFVGCWSALPDTAVAEPQRLSTAQLRALITGKVVHWSGGLGASYFYRNGQYRFEGPGGTALGRYSVANNAVCIKFSNSFARCDIGFRDGTTYFALPLRSVKKKTSPDASRRVMDSVQSFN
jgi:hypothetical protein